MSRTRLRATIVAAGLYLFAAPWLASRLPGGATLPLSIVWAGSAAFLVYAAFLVLRTWLGGVAAAIVVLALVSTPVVLTAIRPSPELAIQLPCPRNWAWLPTWQLRPSPMGSVSVVVGTAKVKICYGRPASRGRRMIGGRYVPFGQLWRTGANEPTTIISTGALEIAGVTVPPGRASLYTVPGPETWEVILNGSTSQWGIESAYTDSVKSRELGRAILRSQEVEPRLERLTLSTEPKADGKTVDLVLRWERTEVRIPLASASR